MGAAFGLEERFKILSATDVQIQEALTRFEQAGELLAARLDLDETANAPVPAPGAGLN